MYFTSGYVSIIGINWEEITKWGKRSSQKFVFTLEKTQNQMAQLLGVSLKAIQSFEQGWRNIPVHIERQVLFLLAMKKSPLKKVKACWVVQKCPMETKRNCPAWELKVGHLCWFINGTICYGEVQGSWEKKMKICRQCTVFQTMLPI